MIFLFQKKYMYLTAVFAVFSVIMLAIATHMHISEGWDLIVFFMGFVLFCMVFCIFAAVLIKYFITRQNNKEKKRLYVLWLYVFVGIFSMYSLLFLHISTCNHIVEGVENIEQTEVHWQQV